MVDLKEALFNECKEYQDRFDRLSSREGLNSLLVCCIHEGHMALLNLIKECGLTKEYEKWCNAKHKEQKAQQLKQNE